MEISLQELVSDLDGYLKTSSYRDASLNGLQVDGGNARISKIAFAVDAGLSVINEAIECGANLLVTHHGLFWGSEQPITKTHGKRISALIQGACSLYVSHLPLDGHPEVGNGAELAKFIGLTSIFPFCEYEGSFIGAKGSYSTPLSRDEALAKVAKISNSKILSLPFGPETISTVGVVTGSGSFAIPLCASEGVDLLVSGEPKQEAYHAARDLGVNCIFAGHYATETFGVKALSRYINERFKIDTIYIEHDTGI